jgi:mRNA interferase MazF
MRRGEVWWANLRKPTASEPGYRHPVVVMQSDEFNQSAVRTVVVIAVTSNTRLAQAPGNVLLSRRSSGLPRESVANVSQLLTVDKSFLLDRVGALPRRLVEEIENGLRLGLAL